MNFEEAGCGDWAKSLTKTKRTAFHGLKDSSKTVGWYEKRCAQKLYKGHRKSLSWPGYNVILVIRFRTILRHVIVCNNHFPRQELLWQLVYLPQFNRISLRYFFLIGESSRNHLVLASTAAALTIRLWSSSAGTVEKSTSCLKGISR